MYSDTQLIGIIKHARAESTKRRFTQSVELIVVLKDIDVKRGFNLLEVVDLPHRIHKNAKICVIASGDMSTRARKAGVDKVIEQDELNRLGTNKREARKIVRLYDFSCRYIAYGKCWSIFRTISWSKRKNAVSCSLWSTY